MKKTLAGELEDNPEKYKYLWSRPADFYVFSLHLNGKLDLKQINILQAIGNAANRVASTHKKLDIRNVVFQYRNKYNAWLATLNGDKATPEDKKKLKNSFGQVNTHGQEKYGGVIRTLAKTSKPLWEIISKLFDNKSPDKFTANSTAPFNGMNKKWNKVKISDETKITLLTKLYDKAIEMKAIQGLWNLEFAKAAFVHTLNDCLTSEYETFEEAISLFDSVTRERIQEVLKLSKIKTSKKLPLSLPEPIPTLILAHKRSQEQPPEQQQEDKSDENKIFSFDSLSGTRHSILNQSAENLPAILKSLRNDFNLYSSSSISMVVCDPPYGLKLAPWDTEEECQKWQDKIIPKTLSYLVESKVLSKDFRFIAFCPLDSSLYMVFFFTLSPFFKKKFTHSPQSLKQTADKLQLDSKTLIWHKETVKSRSKFKFVNNLEAIVVIGHSVATFNSNHPYNSSCISIRPSKKWQNSQDQV